MPSQHHALRHPPAFLELIREAIHKGDGFRLRLFGISMHPFVRAGDLARVRPIAWDAIRPGHVILFQREDRLIAHRVLRVPSSPAEPLIAKGDTLRRADPPVRAEQVLGRVVTIERDGRVLSLDSPGRRLWAAAMVRATTPYSALFYRWYRGKRWVVSRLPALRAWRALRRRGARPVSLVPGAAEDALLLTSLLCDECIDRGFEEVEAATGAEVERVLAAGGRIYLAMDDRSLAGCAVLLPEGEGWRITRLYVHSLWRARGIGRSLLHHALLGAGDAPVVAEVPPGHRAGLALLRSAGFTPVEGQGKRMVLSLTPAAPRLGAGRPLPNASMPRRPTDLAGTDAR
ncbi:MAG TPA: GNAT family N-acetyltransferase [Armatimonadota bacterium]